MSQLFDVREKYFTDEQLKHINEFMKVCPQSKTVVTNAEGKKRMVRTVSLPTGTVGPKTWYSHGRDQDQKDKPHKYHTPAAILTQRTALIAYQDMETGEKKQCDSHKWLDWLGDKYTVKPAKTTKMSVPKSFSRQMDAEAEKAKKKHDEGKKAEAEKDIADDGKSGK